MLKWLRKLIERKKKSARAPSVIRPALEWDLSYATMPLPVMIDDKGTTQVREVCCMVLSHPTRRMKAITLSRRTWRSPWARSAS
jgi:hypothetical protein